MKRNLLKTCVPLGTLLLLSGCIDDNYDISNIDKTTQINVNDLVVPVNMDAIELSEVIKIDDNSKIKIVTVDGKEMYAVTQTGEFNSDPIEIDGFTAPGPQILPARASFNIVPEETRSLSHTTSYTLGDFTPQLVEIKATGVDESIKELTSLSCEPLKITMTLNASGYGANTSIKFESLKINFLKGLTLVNLPSNYKYNSTSGLLEISNLDCPDHKAVIGVTATGVDFVKSGTTLENRDFNYSSSVTLRDAVLLMTVTYDGTMPDAPMTIDFDINTTVTDLVATAFSGQIEYKLEGDQLDIDPVQLNDIPDFLTNHDTNLRLANPQIYLSLNNPLAPYGVNYSTGLQLAAVRGSAREVYDLDPGQMVKVGDNYGVDGPYNYVISPSMPAAPLGDYATHLSHVGFKSLSDVLSGKGIPGSIDIALVDPELPLQTVTDFQLFNSIPGITGKYDFFAPLALKTGDDPAVIVYNGVENGWSDDTLDKLTITKVSVEADATSDVPVDATVSIYPLDKEGNRIMDVTVTPASIKANAKGVKITTSIEGEIKNLDGIRYEAVVTAGAENPLSPEQTIRLENVKAKVSGFYLTDFED